MQSACSHSVALRGLCSLARDEVHAGAVYGMVVRDAIVFSLCGTSTFHACRTCCGCGCCVCCCYAPTLCAATHVGHCAMQRSAAFDRCVRVGAEACLRHALAHTHAWHCAQPCLAWDRTSRHARTGRAAE
jgi:hypothetical protein